MKRGIASCLRSLAGVASALSPTITHGQSTFWSDLRQPPFYEYAPQVTVGTVTDPLTQPATPTAPPEFQLQLSQIEFKLGGTNEAEFWYFRIPGKVSSLENSYRMILSGQEYMVQPNSKNFEFLIEAPSQKARTRIDLVAVHPRGEVSRIGLDLSLEHFPMTSDPNTPIKLRSETRLGLSASVESWAETIAAGSIRSTNIRFPRLQGEWMLYWARTPHTPSFRFTLLASIEYTWPQVAYSTQFAYPLAWNFALRASRFSFGGRAPGVLFSPFLQLEKQGIVYAGAKTTTQLSEAFNVLPSVNAFLFWAQLGFKLEKVLARRNWEISVMGGRSITGIAWSELWDYSRWFGGWQTRLSLRVDLTQRFWAEINGQLTWLSGESAVFGGGGGWVLGLRL